MGKLEQESEDLNLTAIMNRDNDVILHERNGSRNTLSRKRSTDGRTGRRGDRSDSPDRLMEEQEDAFS